MSTGEANRDQDERPDSSGNTSSEGASSVSSVSSVSPLATSVPRPTSIDVDEPVPSTEIDLRRPDFLPPPIVRAPEPIAPPPQRLGRFTASSYDQEATLQSTNEEAAALRAALDAHLVKVSSARAAVVAVTPDEIDDDAADVAPIGPTEIVAGPPSEGAPAPQVAQPKASRAEVERQIRELETKLDQMIEKEGGAAKRPRPVAPPPPSRPASDVHATDFVKQRWGRTALRTRAEEVDEFGHDPAVEARYLKAIDFLYDVYFRVATEGAEHIPETGRCLVVANHSGGPLPYDGLMLRAAIRREHEKAAALTTASSGTWRELRWLAEDFIYYLPFVGSMMNRLGAVRACQENAERLLAKDGLVAVFPEGAKGIGKLYKERYRLQRFGRGGFIRLALRMRTPLVPCAVVGAEEANPLFYRIEGLAKSLGVPYLPITPTFPALGPLGLLPAPTKWKIEFGEPISFDAYGPDAAEDDLLVGRLAEQVRATIQAMVDRMVSGRRSIWFG
jgi:1-acyl-sn-glycerol-3-phosphate acyltransferase